MAFHRYAVPTYAGGLPSGYDYINNAISGTPAPADGAKGSGTHAGSYFIAFGEDATSNNSNRANKALSENCDFLDDLFNTSQVVMRYVDVTPGSSTTETALTGEIYVGGSGETPAVVNNQETRDRLVHFVDASGNDLVINGNKVTATLIDDGAYTNVVGVPASGFQTNPSVRSSETLPSGTPYRMYYLLQRNLSDVIQNKPAEFFLEQIRTASSGASSFSVAKLIDLYLHGMDDMYRRSSTYDATPPPYWPGLAPTADTAGNGAWFVKDGWPLMAYPTFGGASLAGTQGAEDYWFGAAYGVDIRTNYTFTLDAHRSAGGSGVVVLGRKKSGKNDPTHGGDPGLFGFFHGTIRESGDALNTNDATVFDVGDVLAISGDQLTVNTGWLYANLGSSDRSAFVLGHDILAIRPHGGGDIEYVTITEFTSTTVGTIAYLDGSVPNLAGDWDFLGWISPMLFSSENAGTYHEDIIGGTAPPAFLNGFEVAESPKVRYTDAWPTYRPPVASFYAGDSSSSTKVVAWGGYLGLSPTTTGATYQLLSWLSGDGGAEFNGAVAFKATPTFTAPAKMEGSGVASAAGDQVPAIQTTTVPTAYKVLWERNTTTTDEKSRMHTDISGGTVLTINAYFDGTDWRRDVLGDASRVTINNLGSISRNYASSGAAGTVVDWTEKTQFVTAYARHSMPFTTGTPAWSNTTGAHTVVTGMTDTIALLTDDIVKITAQGSFDKAGTTNGGEVQIRAGGTPIADSLRYLGTDTIIHPVSITTVYVAVADSSITFDMTGRTAGSDSLSTTGQASFLVEVLRPE